MLLEVIQAVIFLLGMQAAGGVESLRVTSRAQSPLLLAQGSTEVHSKSLTPGRCLQSSEERETGKRLGHCHCTSLAPVACPYWFGAR